jgi:phospholipid/cholesterol/gamma-HCH transport system permease protein
VGIALVRELGPVLTAVFVTGLAGSALTAELGIMRITEQIDALMVMALNPMRYLVVPAILAGIISFPMLTAIFDVAGIPTILASRYTCRQERRFGRMRTFADMADVMVGFTNPSPSARGAWVCGQGFPAGARRCTRDDQAVVSPLQYVSSSTTSWAPCA